MPPVILDNIVVPPHIVADFARLGRQLSREGLVKGTMGAISMLHPDEPGLMISTRHSTMLARLDERGIVGGPLGGNPPVAPLVNGRFTKFSLLPLQHSLLVVRQHASTCKGHTQLQQVVRRTSFLSNQLTFSVKNTLARLLLSILMMMLRMNSFARSQKALQQGGMRCVVRGHGAYWLEQS